MGKYLVTIGAAIVCANLLLMIMPKASSNPLFLMGMPLALIVLLVLIINPILMLLIILFTRIPFEPFFDLSRLGEGGMGIGAGFNLLVILLGCYFAVRESETFKKLPFLRVWIFFLAVAFISCTYSSVPFTGIRLALNLTTYFVMAILPFFIIRTTADRDQWLKVLFWTTLVPILGTNLHILTGNLPDGRVQGFFHHPNQLAFYAMFVLTLCFLILQGGFFTLSRFSKNLIFLLIINVFFILLMTQTRSAWVAVWMCLLIYGLLSERRYLWAAMVLPFLAFLHPEVQNRVMDLFQGNTPGGYRKLNSFAWRKELWKSALPWIQERPWFGYGLASFKPTTLQFFKNAVGSGSGAHNTYLEIAFEMGLAGLLPFLLLFKEYVFRFFSAMKKLKGGLSKRYAIMVAFVLSYMIICTSDNLLHYLTFNWYFWFFTGLMLKSYFLDSANKTT